MLKEFSLTLLAIFLSTVFISSVYALDCRSCTVGACYCNVTECSTGSISVFTTQCVGIPSKEIIFTNNSFLWTASQAKNYYFQVFCDSGTKSNCTNVDLSSVVIPTTTSTTSSTTTTYTPQKESCPYDCCIGEADYYSKYCDEGYECSNTRCVEIQTSTTTTTESGPQISYSLIIVVVVVIVAAVAAFYFLKMRKQQPQDKWKDLYEKYGRR